MNGQASVARALVSGFADAGVAHVVLSPGSRSTPFVLAAHAEPRLTLHDIVDERVASFFALGIARASGRPALIITTSGSAPAHALPAVLEAARAQLPLVVLSADRPAQLQACGANQTAEQRDLFGRHVRLALSLPETNDGMPEAELSLTMRVAARLAAQLVSTSRGRRPGPVHLNAPVHKPLEPRCDAPSLDAPPAPRLFSGRMAPSAAAVMALVQALSSARRGLLVAGPTVAQCSELAAQVGDVCRAFGLTLAAESCSGLRFAPELRDVPRLDHADALYRDIELRRLHAPDVVLSLHDFPVSRGVGEMLGQAGVRHLAVGGGECPDAASRLALWVDADESLTLAALLQAASPRPTPDETFQAGLREYDAAWARRASALLEAEGDALTPQSVLAEVAQSRARLWLGLGNGLTVRRADDWIAPHADISVVLHQRGLSGIDGLVAGAAGAACVADAPVTFVLGDVAFRHDVAGLAAAAQLDETLVLVVIDDGGGRIFEQLPIGARADLADAMSHFTTPSDSHAEKAAALFGLPCAAPRSRPELRNALAQAYARAGASVIVVRVDAAQAAELDRAAREARS